VTFPMLPQAQVTRVKGAEDMDNRLRELEFKLQALQTPPLAEGTPKEPPKVEEPPAKSIEPELDHSLLESLIATIPR